MISPKVFTFFLALALSNSTRAAMTFAEDFSSLARGPNLVVTGGSETTIDYSGGTAKFTGAMSSGSTRAYLGTDLTFDLAVAFTAEIDVSVPDGSTGNGLAFFGFGTGQRGDSSVVDGAPSYYEPSTGPTAYLALLPSDFGNGVGSMIASADLNSSILSGTSLVIPGSGPVGSGNHKLQMIYNGAGFLQFAYKKEGATGPGDPWVVASTIDISDNGFTNFNGRVFFGGSGDVTFDNLSVTGVLVPEPSIASLFAIVSCAALFRRRR